MDRGSGIGKQLHQGIHFLIIQRVYELVQSGSGWRKRTIWRTVGRRHAGTIAVWSV